MHAIWLLQFCMVEARAEPDGTRAETDESI